MKIKGLDGREYSLNFVEKRRGKVSQYHENARTLLLELFPFDKIYEEVGLPGSATSKNGQLTVDFFIPSKLLIIEVQGQQHEQYNSFFYPNRLDFFKAQARDRTKKEWCEINGLTLIELPYDKSNEWASTVKNRGEVETGGRDTE
jgi:hypothetical protein